jgi:hypothetical protein
MIIVIQSSPRHHPVIQLHIFDATIRIPVRQGSGVLPLPLAGEGSEGFCSCRPRAFSPRT